MDINISVVNYNVYMDLLNNLNINRYLLELDNIWHNILFTLQI